MITIIADLAFVLMLLVMLRTAQSRAKFWNAQATQFADQVMAAHAQTDRVIKLNMETFDIAKQVPVLQQRLDHIASICESKEAQQVGLQLGSTSFKSVRRWANWRADQ